MFDTTAIVESHKHYMQSLRAEVRQARKRRSLQERELEKGFKQLRSALVCELPEKSYSKWFRAAPVVVALATCTLLVM